MTNKKANIYVIHGYTATSQSEWFPWLKNSLTKTFEEVVVFDMPNSNAPVPCEWDEYLNNNVYNCNENTFFVGHSLGCIALLRYLEKQPKDKIIGGAILVSGFLEPVPTLSILDPFIKSDLNIRKLIQMIKKRLVITSITDTIVNCKYSCNLAEQMEAKLINLESGGHFIAQEGFAKFPLVFNELCKMIIK